MSAIVTHNLTRRFGAITALDGLTLSVTQGELFGLVGSDGAGKTTTLRLLAGILDPSDGEASVLGSRFPDGAGAVREDIGYMSQRFGLYQDLTVAENIAFYADVFGVVGRERRERSERLLEFSGLAPFTARPAGKLSGGMKQRVGLAMALVHRPRFVILDEPTNGLDPKTQCFLIELIFKLNEAGKTIVIATHDLTLVGELDSEVAVLSEDHRVERAGMADEVLRDEDLLLKVNLIHEHMHSHGQTTHKHPHQHYLPHKH